MCETLQLPRHRLSIRKSFVWRYSNAERVVDIAYERWWSVFSFDVDGPHLVKQQDSKYPFRTINWLHLFFDPNEGICLKRKILERYQFDTETNERLPDLFSLDMITGELCMDRPLPMRKPKPEQPPKQPEQCCVLA